MKEIQEPARELPVVADVDVVVVGGGPGGFSAAIAAARHGASTLLVETHGFLGGMASAGLVAPVLGHTAHETAEPIVEGILRQVTERMHALGCAPTWQESLEMQRIPFDAEALKIVLDELCADVGVQVLFHTWLAGSIMEDGRIKAIVVENKSGRQAIAARVFVDATGDADLAVSAGALTTHGRPFDNKGESMGSFFHLGGVPELSAERRQEIAVQVEREMEDGRFRFYNAGFLNKNAHHKDHTSANMTRFSGDSDSGADFSAGESAVRRDVWDLVRYLRATVPEFADVYVQQTSPQIGPRESRQIVGPYALTGDDINRGFKFEDAIARGSWWIDIHCPLGHTFPVHLRVKDCPMGADCAYWVAEHENMRLRSELYPPYGDWYTVPYRCLLSVNVPNLLASGRCISATHEGIAGARIMSTCMAIGEAAGTAAAMALESGCELAGIDVPRLRKTLVEDGALV